MKAIILLILLVAVPSGIAQAISPSNNDVWDVSQGTTLQSTTALAPQADPLGMFGSTIPSAEMGSSLFIDGLPEGTVHAIEWKSSAPIGFDQINIFASGDPITYEQEFSSVRIYSKLTESDPYSLLLNFSPARPYSSVAPEAAPLLATNIDTAIAQYFRAEFTQAGLKGPRVLELDAFLNFARSTAPSVHDLWDLSNGAVVITNTAVRNGFSILSLFGSQQPAAEPLTTIFADGSPAHFVHSVVWKTPAPVQLDNIRIFAAGDGEANMNQREFDSIVISSKMTEADAFVPLFSFIPTHPYSFVDPATRFLADGSFPAATGQYFEAEITQSDVGTAYNGPRLMELDAFGPSRLVIKPTAPLFYQSVRVVAVGPQGTVVRYTTDSTNPGPGSPWIGAGILLTASTAVTFQVFNGDAAIGDPAKITFVRFQIPDDEIPSDWRTKYFGADFRDNPSAAADADPDADGFTNLQEYRNSTDPLDPYDTSIRLAPVITWNALLNSIYRITKQESIEITNSTVLVPALRATNKVMRWVDLNNTNSKAFYRVQKTSP